MMKNTTFFSKVFHIYQKQPISIVILVGDTGVGKTHLLSRYIKGQRPKNNFPTIGVEFATKPVPLRTGGTVKAQIWDTGKYFSFKYFYL